MSPGGLSSQRSLPQRHKALTATFQTMFDGLIVLLWTALARDPAQLRLRQKLSFLHDSPPHQVWHYRPGQINDYRGETNTLAKMKKRIEYDIQCIDNWSFWFDLKILVETIPALLHDEAY